LLRILFSPFVCVILNIIHRKAFDSCFYIIFILVFQKSQSVIQPYLELKKIIFFDNNDGLGVGVGDGVAVALTSDGGIPWSFKVLNDVSMVHEIIKTGPNSAWAYGSDGSVYKTDDRGINWRTFSSPYYVCSIPIYR
jgi:hypothetical protein